MKVEHEAASPNSKPIFDAEMGGPSGKLQKLMDNMVEVDPDPHLSPLYGDAKWHKDHESLVSGRHGFQGGYEPELDEGGGISYHRGGVWTNNLGKRVPVAHVIKPVLGLNRDKMTPSDPDQELQYFAVSSIPGDEGQVYRTLQDAATRPSSLGNRWNHPGRGRSPRSLSEGFMNNQGGKKTVAAVVPGDPQHGLGTGHTAPGVDNPTFDDPENYLPDVYEHPEYYVSPFDRRDPRVHRSGVESHRALLTARGNPDAQVKIYRAVPHGITEIEGHTNPAGASWVSPSPTYAERHADAESCPSCGGDMQIISGVARAGDLHNEGYLEEWGYTGDPIRDDSALTECPEGAYEARKEAERRWLNREAAAEIPDDDADFSINFDPESAEALERFQQNLEESERAERLFNEHGEDYEEASRRRDQEERAEYDQPEFPGATWRKLYPNKGLDLFEPARYPGDKGIEPWQGSKRRVQQTKPLIGEDADTINHELGVPKRSLSAAIPDESGIKAAGIAVIAMDTGRVLMQQRALNPMMCPCGQGVTWDESNGYQHEDGSVSHDSDEFYGQSVSDLLDQGHPELAKEAAWDDERGEFLYDIHRPDYHKSDHPPSFDSSTRQPMYQFKDDTHSDDPREDENGFSRSVVLPMEAWTHGPRRPCAVCNYPEYRGIHQDDDYENYEHEYVPSTDLPSGERLAAYTAALEFDPNEGTWEFPGGKLDEGESPRAAAMREFREEVGQDLPPGVFVGAWVSPGGIVVSASAFEGPSAQHQRDLAALGWKRVDPHSWNLDDPQTGTKHSADWDDGTWHLTSSAPEGWGVPQEWHQLHPQAAQDTEDAYRYQESEHDSPEALHGQAKVNSASFGGLGEGAVKSLDPKSHPLIGEFNRFVDYTPDPSHEPMHRLNMVVVEADYHTSPDQSDVDWLTNEGSKFGWREYKGFGGGGHFYERHLPDGTMHAMVWHPLDGKWGGEVIDAEGRSTFGSKIPTFRSAMEAHTGLSDAYGSGSSEQSREVNRANKVQESNQGYNPRSTVDHVMPDFAVKEDMFRRLNAAGDLPQRNQPNPPEEHLKALTESGWRMRHPEQSRALPDFTKLSPSTGITHQLSWGRQGGPGWIYDATVPDTNDVGGHRLVNEADPKRTMMGKGSVPVSGPEEANKAYKSYERSWLMGSPHGEKGVVHHFDPEAEKELMWQRTQEAYERTREGNPLLDEGRDGVVYQEFDPYTHEHEEFREDPHAGGPLGKLNSVEPMQRLNGNRVDAPWQNPDGWERWDGEDRSWTGADWPEESARRPSRRDMRTLVVQPFIGLKKDQFADPEDPHTVLSDAMKKDWQPEDAEHPLHHLAARKAPVYKGFIYLIQNERDIDLSMREHANPDDPDGDMSEQSAWWDIEHARKNPALRKEVKQTPWAELELWADKSVRNNKQIKEAVSKLSMSLTKRDQDNLAFPHDQEKPVYVRFGDWPTDERSMNHITGHREEGVSVYELNKQGVPVDPDSAMDRGYLDWDEEGNPVGEQNDEYLDDTADMLRGHLADARRGYNSKPDRRAHLVTGELVGFGHGDEPVLRNLERVGHWPCDVHKFIPGLKPSRANWCDNQDHEDDMPHEASAKPAAGKTKCMYCKERSTKEIIHSEGMARIPVCGAHLSKGKTDAANCTPDGSHDPSNIDSIKSTAGTQAPSQRVFPLIRDAITAGRPEFSLRAPDEVDGRHHDMISDSARPVYHQEKTFDPTTPNIYAIRNQAAKDYTFLAPVTHNETGEDGWLRGRAGGDPSTWRLYDDTDEGVQMAMLGKHPDKVRPIPADKRYIRQRATGKPPLEEGDVPLDEQGHQLVEPRRDTWSEFGAIRGFADEESPWWVVS